MNITKLKGNFRLAIITFVFFCFLIDSGSPIGIRNIAFLIVLFCAVLTMIGLCKGRTFPINIYLLIMLALIFVVFGAFTTVINLLDVTNVFKWLSAFISLPFFIFFMFFFSKRDILIGYISGGICFCIIILTVFTLALVLPENIITLVFLVFEDFPGWFYLRHNTMVGTYPNIYFQATLCIVPLAIVSYFQGYKKCAFFFSMTLILCLSRFGFFSVIVAILINKLLNSKLLPTEMLRTSWLVLPFVILTLFISFFLLFSSSYTYEEFNGSSIRAGYIISIFNDLSIKSFIFGDGAGSYFSPIGSYSWVDNIEISQLEVFRKYGIIGFLLFHSTFVPLAFYLYKKRCFSFLITLFMFYIACLSNPVLLSFNFSILLSVLIRLSTHGGYTTKKLT